MTPVEVVRERLLDVTGVTAIVGSRIWPVKLPQKPTLPAIRLMLVGVIEFVHLRGLDALQRARVQVDAVTAESSGVDAYSQAQALSAAAHGAFVNGVATGLAGWKGWLGGSPAVEVQAILPDGRFEGYDPDELRQVRVSQDYLVWFKG